VKIKLTDKSAFRRVASSCAMAAIGVVAVATAHPARAATTALISAPTGMCLDVEKGDPTPRTRVQIWPCNGGKNQSWEFTAASELRTLDGTRCLDVRGASSEPKAVVQSYTCTGGANQKWALKPDGTVAGVQSGLCLTVLGAATVQGTGVDLWPCGALQHQTWSHPGVGSGSDTTAPSVPSGLAIANLACKSATLSWVGSTDNVRVVAYDIYHDGQRLTSVDAAARSAALTLTPGARWGLYVNARDAAGNASQASPSLVVNVPQCTLDTQAPSVPGGLSGTAAGTTATLKWSAATDNIGVASYDIYRDDVKVGNTANLTYTDSGLAANKAFRYAVAARDAQNNVSARSTSVSVTTGGSCSNAVCDTQTIATETDVPWGLVTLPDGTIIYSRRDARNVVRLDPVTGRKTDLGKVPEVDGTNGEGGLLGLAVSPDFPVADNWLYIYHTSATDNRIVRIRYINGALDMTTEQVLLKGIARNRFHNGGRLRYGPDGKLYAAVGDGQMELTAPQEKNSLNGKVLRLNTDGSVPSDNPFGNYTWSYGHRNPQGLAFDSQGRLWEQEFGDGSEDETNLIEKGGNYGWPDCEGTVSKRGGGCRTAGFIAPKFAYKTFEGSCSGIAIVREVLYVACQKGERLYRHVISGESLTNSQQLFQGTYGRLRTVEPTRDGGLWLSTTIGGSDGEDKDSVADNSNNKILKVILGN
jgi:glucose/arabinose dehydrogenase